MGVGFEFGGYDYHCRQTLWIAVLAKDSKIIMLHHIRTIEKNIVFLILPLNCYIKWVDVMETGSRQPDTAVNERLQRMAINNCCMVICTVSWIQGHIFELHHNCHSSCTNCWTFFVNIFEQSGSTGLPKAAMLTHDYCVMTPATIQKHIGAEMCEEVLISFMPLNHCSGMVCELFACLISASPMYFAPDALRVCSFALFAMMNIYLIPQGCKR
jgi:hypothetical protein